MGSAVLHPKPGIRAHCVSQITVHGQHGILTTVNSHCGPHCLEAGENKIQIEDTDVRITVGRYWKGGGGTGQIFELKFPAGTFPDPEMDGAKPETMHVILASTWASFTEPIVTFLL